MIYSCCSEAATRILCCCVIAVNPSDSEQTLVPSLQTPRIDICCSEAATAKMRYVAHFSIRDDNLGPPDSSESLRAPSDRRALGAATCMRVSSSSSSRGLWGSVVRGQSPHPPLRCACSDLFLAALPAGHKGRLLVPAEVEQNKIGPFLCVCSYSGLLGRGMTSLPADVYRHPVPDRVAWGLMSLAEDLYHHPLSKGFS